MLSRATADSPSSAISVCQPYHLLSEKIRRRRFPLRYRTSWIAAALICAGILAANLLWKVALSLTPPRSAQPGHVTRYLGCTSRYRAKPSDLELIALVMYTSRERTSILDYYLQRNLARNGGLLDQVVFVPQTGHEQHLAWLDALVTASPGYALCAEPGQNSSGSAQSADESDRPSEYSRAWPVATDGPLYILINGETVFLADDAIASLVGTRLDYPEYFLIHANVINQPVLSWVHHRLGVVRPYRPERRPPSRSRLHTQNDSATAASSTRPRLHRPWRASELPPWIEATQSTEAGDDSPRAATSDMPALFGITTGFEPPFQGHRWLPYAPGSPTPNIPTLIPQETLVQNGGGRWPWTLSAQHHYSFLEHVEEEIDRRSNFSSPAPPPPSPPPPPAPRRRLGLDAYKFPLWEYQTEKIGLSVAAIWGRDMIATPWPPPLPPSSSAEGDEDRHALHPPEIARWLSETVPQQTGRGAVVDGHALAARFAADRDGDGDGHAGLESTDLLERYRALAEEMAAGFLE